MKHIELTMLQQARDALVTNEPLEYNCVIPARILRHLLDCLDKSVPKEKLLEWLDIHYEDYECIDNLIRAINSGKFKD